MEKTLRDNKIFYDKPHKNNIYICNIIMIPLKIYRNRNEHEKGKIYLVLR